MFLVIFGNIFFTFFFTFFVFVYKKPFSLEVVALKNEGPGLPFQKKNKGTASTVASSTQNLMQELF